MLALPDAYQSDCLHFYHSLAMHFLYSELSQMQVYTRSMLTTITQERWLLSFGGTWIMKMIHTNGLWVFIPQICPSRCSWSECSHIKCKEFTGSSSRNLVGFDSHWKTYRGNKEDKVVVICYENSGLGDTLKSASWS